MNVYRVKRIKQIKASAVLISLCVCASASGQVQAQRHGTKPDALVTSAIRSDSGTAGDFTSSIPSDKALHIVVGRSMTINTKNRLTRVYVTNPSILYAYMASPNEVLVTAKQGGVSSLMLWDSAGGTHSYLLSSDLDITTLQESLKKAMPSEDVRVEGNEGRIILSGNISSAGQADAAIKIAGLYSKDVSNALIINSSSIKQVKLKVRIVEVDRSKLDQLGFNFFSAGGNNLAQTSTNQFPSSLIASAAGASAGSGGGGGSTAGSKTVSISNPLNFMFYSSKLNIGATLQDMETRQVLQILAEPTITTLSGQKANFLSGGEFPFPVVQGVAGGLTSISIQFKPFGVKVEFTPEVNADGSILLAVAPEVSSLDYTNAVTISGYTIPALSTRKAETEVVLRSGQSFAISGLLDKNTTDSFGGTPGFSSIPLLGALFKSKSINHSTTELIVIVTPTIVDPMTESFTEQAPQIAIPPLNKSTFDATLPKAKDTK